MHLLADAGGLGFVLGLTVAIALRIRRGAWDFVWVTSLTLMQQGIVSGMKFDNLTTHDTISVGVGYLNVVWSCLFVLAVLMVLPRRKGWSAYTLHWAISASLAAVGVGALSFSLGYEYQSDVLRLARVFSMIAATSAALGLGAHVIRIGTTSDVQD